MGGRWVVGERVVYICEYEDEYFRLRISTDKISQDFIRKFIDKKTDFILNYYTDLGEYNKKYIIFNEYIDQFGSLLSFLKELKIILD